MHCVYVYIHTCVCVLSVYVSSISLHLLQFPLLLFFYTSSCCIGNPIPSVYLATELLSFHPSHHCVLSVFQCGDFYRPSLHAALRLQTDLLELCRYLAAFLKSSPVQHSAQNFFFHVANMITINFKVNVHVSNIFLGYQSHFSAFHMSQNSFFPRFIFIHACVSLWICLCHRYVGAHQGQKRASDPLGLESPAVELADHGCWEPKLMSSTRAGSSLSL